MFILLLFHKLARVTNQPGRLLPKHKFTPPSIISQICPTLNDKINPFFGLNIYSISCSCGSVDKIINQDTKYFLTIHRSLSHAPTSKPVRSVNPSSSPDRLRNSKPAIREHMIVEKSSNRVYHCIPFLLKKSHPFAAKLVL